MKVLAIVAVLLSATVVVTNTEPVAAPQLGGAEAILRATVDLVDRLLTDGIGRITGTSPAVAGSSASILSRLLAELLAPILIAVLGPALTLTISLNGLLSLLNNLLLTYNGPYQTVLTLFVQLLVTFT